MLISISDTPTNERGPRHMRSILAAIHHAASKNHPVSFIIGRHEQQVGLYCRFPGLLHRLIKGQFHAKYPDCTIELLDDDALDCPVGFETWSISLHLRPDLFPILRYQQFEDVIHNEVDDPIGGVLQTIAADSSDVRAMIELSVIPAHAGRVRYSQTAVEQLARPFFRKHRGFARQYAFFISSPKHWQRNLAGLFSQFFASKREERLVSDEELNKTSSRMHDNEKDLQAASVKLGQHLFEVQFAFDRTCSRRSKADSDSKIERDGGGTQ